MQFKESRTLTSDMGNQNFHSVLAYNKYNEIQCTLNLSKSTFIK